MLVGVICRNMRQPWRGLGVTLNCWHISRSINTDLFIFKEKSANPNTRVRETTHVTMMASAPS